MRAPVFVPRKLVGFDAGPDMDGGVVVDQPTMTVGYNYAWGDFGFDLGPTKYFPNDPSQWARWRSTLGPNLTRLHDLGIRVVRWFLLANGFTYGPDPTLRMAPGQTLDPHVDYSGQGDWTFIPPTELHPSFLEHFRALLQAFLDAQMLLIPSLISFEFCSPGTFANPRTTVPGTDSGGYQESRPVYTYANDMRLVGGGRADCVRDPAKRRIFFETVLQPLLDASAPFRAAIYAWEIMNEPEWVTIDSGYLGRFTTTVPRPEMWRFLDEAVGLIQGADFPSTVGLASFRSIEAGWPRGSRPQYHYYGSPPQIPWAHETRSTPPAFVGEFAPYNHNPWSVGPNGRAARTTFERLQYWQMLNYELAMLWPNMPDNTARTRLRLDDVAQADVARFTGGHM